ncbi:MAG: M48 family metalloprotease [Candidatus Marinimicrobia bacterium]|nr:M48 family metalloprotease [Candidatus Neomarinimicrobiota bacterium]MCF7828864.1 M48 family metalloprotease [Candidatus Neomarinimicrobiota bacterium]MCF7880781.1 M48 family metalloprotease [Candidatus Neomarinimicrobiota bacterium]
MKGLLNVIISLVVLIIGSTGFCGETATVERERATLREGPGSFFPAVAELQKGTEVEQLEAQEHWIKVSVEELNGYVSEKAVQAGKAKSEDPFAKMSATPSVTKVAQSGVSAAVKGFAEKYAHRLEGDGSFLETLYSYRIDPRRYQQFRQETYADRNLRKLRRKVDLPRQRGRDVFSFPEEGVGLGIASRIAELGIYENRNLQNYVNFVGNLVVEASDSWDQGFKFFILDVDKVNAYSCPGGIVFITKGAIERMQNEAELACFMGHEIAHVVLRHGMKELEKRKVMVTADNAFMELESETEMSSDIQSTSDDLENIAIESYETIFSGRLQEYEDEADEYGLTIAARAGYAPSAMVDYLGRISAGKTLSGNEHYTTEQNAERREQIIQWIDDTRFPDELLVKDSSRFATQTGGM